MTDDEKRKNLSKNIEYLAGHFRSHAMLSRLLKCPPKFVNRAVNTPNELSIASTDCASKSLCISEEVLLGDLKTFKKSVARWIKDKKRMIDDRRESRTRSKRPKSSSAR